MSTINSVVIAGGGIGGLALAVGLRQLGVEVVVLERAAQFAETGSGLVLSPNGLRAAAALDTDLADDIQAAGHVFGAGHRSRFVTGGGKTLAEVSFAGSGRTWGMPIVSIQRARLQDLLLRHASRKGADVRTGVAVDAVQETGSGVAASATSTDPPAEAELLVGADGLRSAVRRHLLADSDPTYRGFTAVRGVGPAPAGDPEGFIAYGRGLILFASAIGGGQVYWVASITAPAGVWPAKSAATAHDDLMALLAGWDPELRGVVAGSDPAGHVLTDIYDRDPVETWHRGRVALLGDAAHPMVYTMGQGANTTLEDAAVLAHQLQNTATLDEALNSYTAARAPRTAKIARQSRMMGRIGQQANPVTAWFRDRMMSAMMRFGDLEKQNAEVFGWQPPH